MTDQKATPAPKVDETKGEKFKRLASGRVGIALEKIGQLENLANKAQYDFTAEQVDKIFNTIGDELDRVSAIYKAALEGKAVVTKSGFSL